MALEIKADLSGTNESDFRARLRTPISGFDFRDREER